MPGVSIDSNGYPRIEGHYGPITLNGDRLGVFPNHIAALWTLRHSQATRDCNAFMIIEDDVALPQGLKAYLDQVLWPDEETAIGGLLLFTHRIFAGIAPGWHTWNTSIYHTLWGAQALAFSAAGLDAWLASPLHCLHEEKKAAAANAFADSELTKFCSVYNRSLWFAVGNGGNSLIAHLGTESSVFGGGAGSMPGRNERAFAGRTIESPTWSDNLKTEPTAAAAPVVSPAKQIIGETYSQRAERRLAKCVKCVHWISQEESGPDLAQGCNQCVQIAIKPTLANIGAVGPRCKRGYWI